MSLTVRDVLSLNVLRGARVVAGRDGLDHPIRWIHILDMPEVTEWTKGGEVLLTSGLGIYGNPAMQEKYLREAIEKKVAAVFLTAGEYMAHATPRMRELADAGNLPLVEIPRTTPFVEITEAILRRLSQRSPEGDRDYLLDALLAGNLPETEEAQSQLAALGIEPGRPHALALVRRARGGDQPLRGANARALKEALAGLSRRPLLFARPHFLVAIFPMSPRDTSSLPFARELAGTLRGARARGLRMAFGRLARRLPDFAISFREARQALFIASLTGRAETVLHFNELGAWRLLLRVNDRTELERFVDFYLSPLLEHDRAAETDWTTTLETYLEQNGNLRATARALGLHRNTVAYQLERIGQLLGRDLNDTETRLNLQLAFRARLLLSASPLAM